MNVEEIRQLIWHFMQDEKCSPAELASAIGLDENEVTHFIYGASYPDETIGSFLREYMLEQFKKRDELQLALIKGLHGRIKKDKDKKE